MGCFAAIIRGIKRTVSPPGQTPLDPVIMAIIFICNLANAMIITMPFSFLPRMIRDFGFQEKEVGYNVGLVASSLYIGRALGSYTWGWLCDRIGRKSSLIISSTLILISTIFFGFSQSLAWTITARLFQGAFGGMIIALKATVFALCDETNNSLGMAIVLCSFQIGLIIGPAVGGYLVFPAESFPNTFSKDSIFGRFPFFLPILINSIILAISILMAAFKIPETLKKDKEETKLLNDKKNCVNQPFSKNLRFESQKNLDIYAYDVFISRESYTVLATKAEYNSESHTDNALDGNFSVSHFQVLDESHLHSLVRSTSSRPTKWFRSFKESSLWALLRIRDVQVSLCLYGIFSFITIGFDEMFPIFADSSKVYGGLAFSSSEIGTAILLAAAPMVVLVFLVARLCRSIGEKMALIVTLYVMIFGLPLFPLVALVPSRYVWYALVPALFVERCSMSMAFLAVNVALNNSTDEKYIGLVNGLGMTTSCVFRAISPSILGALYSWSLKNEGRLGYPFNHVFPFVLCSFIGLLTLVNASFLPDKRPDVNLIHSEAASDNVTSEEEDNEGDIAKL